MIEENEVNSVFY